jgi:hypothetical protein
MFANLQNKYDWVMDVLTYDSTETIVQALDLIALTMRFKAALLSTPSEKSAS